MGSPWGQLVAAPDDTRRNARKYGGLWVARTPDLSDVNDTHGVYDGPQMRICSTNVHAHRRWSMELGGQIGRQHEVVTVSSSSRFAQRPEERR